MRQVQNIPEILSSLQLVCGLLIAVFWDQPSPSQTHTWFLKLKFRVLIFCCWLRSKRLKEGRGEVALTRKGGPPPTRQTLRGILGSSFFFFFCHLNSIFQIRRQKSSKFTEPRRWSSWTYNAGCVPRAHAPSLPGLPPAPLLRQTGSPRLSKSSGIPDTSSPITEGRNDSPCLA